MPFIDEVLLRADEEKWRTTSTATEAVAVYTTVVAALPSAKTELTKWKNNNNSEEKK